MATIFDRLGTLAAPVRVRLLRLLEVEELGVGEIAQVVQLPQSTVSRHLKVLLDEGWVSRRPDGTAAFFRLAERMPEGAEALWDVVRAATDDDHPEDGLRLASVLAARQVDSRAFFGRVGASWATLRRELYGDGFLLHALAALLPEDRVVADLGCGTGDLLVALAPCVRRALGVDREPAMLEAAALQLRDHPHVELRQGSLEDPPLAEGEVDAALFVLVLHHLDAPGLALRGARRALTPEGRVVVVDMVAHDRDDYRRTMGHRHLGFDEDELASLAEDAGLRVRRRVVVPPAPEASGPAVFVAVLVPAEVSSRAARP
ncbi:MAG: metalloregulator ArsR/SmtB family transcription factor [Alphaproteobacteria bacterium]|nr:metalloregulator ArsR/SmtB family transcription factor [Alphaproteobacteria bacterium]